MSFSLDLTDDYQRTMWVLHSRISQLSIEITTGMHHSRGSVLAACWREGFTTLRTKGGAFADLLTLAHTLNPNYDIAPVHLNALLVWKKGDVKKRDAAVRKIKRDAVKWAAEGRPGSQANPA